MQLFENYIESLKQDDINNVTEHTYRKDLQILIEGIAKKSKSKITIQHEPKREKGFGAPDFKVKTIESIIGYVENKKLTEDLNKTLKSDQIKKYNSLSTNILLTNYIEWIWIKDGEVIDRAKLCELSDIENKMSFFLSKENFSRVKSIIENFLSQTPKGISRPKQLAEALAIRARFLRDFLEVELIRQEKENREGKLFGLFETFKDNIFSELSAKEFSDAFSQTLVYGLFLSKLNADSEIITLYNAKKYILPAFGLIKELVDFLDDLENEEYKDAKWIVEEILSVMNTLNLPKILKSLSYEKKKTTNLFDEENITYKDPYIYFYEDFLAAYDKSLRKKRGVYYTPPQVVNFIVRSLSSILKEKFGIESGFADKDNVNVLDFATGTGTFLIEILEEIFENLPAGSGKKNALIKDHVLKNFYGFEYLIAPYTIANLKLSQFLKDQGYQLQKDDRFQIYLTNTLEPINKHLKIPLLPSLSKESQEAQKVKEKQILVITGNPPYSGVSKNKGKWISDLIDTYKYVDGEHFKEKKHWLGDDYVKFIRFAQHKMDQVEEGVVGIITNHRFTSNPTFRGMRQSLMKSFDQIYILDLHGSNKPKELAPDGSPDENVFDIEQGVAISFFIKKQGLEKKIYHSDLYGKREEKYDFCIQNTIESLDWKEINPESPFYLFNQVEGNEDTNYKNSIVFDEIFIKSSTGVQSSRDSLVIAFNQDELKDKLDYFIYEKSENALLKFTLKNTSFWNIEKAKSLLANNISENDIMSISYRPLDVRFIFYNNAVIHRKKEEIMKNFYEKNIGICIGRAGQNVNQAVDWNLAFITDKIIDLNLFYRGGELLFPLYLYENDNGLFSDVEKTKTENFTEKFRTFINEKYNNPTGEEIIYYIYALLFSPAYRKKYRSQLDIDFPKVIFTDDFEVFKKMSALGKEISEAHLRKKKISEKDFPFGNYKGNGGNVVVARKFVANEKDQTIGKLYINESQYFDEVPTEVWNFYIGGYQVLDKYLKDRKDRKLNLEEIENIEQIIKSIEYTRCKMKEINEVTESWL